jgi:hypothetical protein
LDVLLKVETVLICCLTIGRRQSRGKITFKVISLVEIEELVSLLLVLDVFSVCTQTLKRLIGETPINVSADFAL